MKRTKLYPPACLNLRKTLSRKTNPAGLIWWYYDEIGLLKPTSKSDVGYRLYDDKALETLQQILFFREFDIPLKEIKAVMLPGKNGWSV